MQDCLQCPLMLNFLVKLSKHTEAAKLDIFQDRNGPTTGNSYTPLDPGQNLELLDGSECDGWTIIKFRRELAACEAVNDKEITVGI